MLKVYSKKTISTILASSLVIGLGTAVVSAAPNTNKSVTTGRTEQNVATGVITPDKIPTLAHGATDVTITGTVVIDGPQVVLLVNGLDVSNQATLTKVADKTWTYKYKTSVGNQTGDVTFNIGAYTIYTNGKPAGQTHTTATGVGQTVHVPFVKSYNYTNLNWTGYDRFANEFTFSYNLVKVWDDGVHEVVTDPVNASVSGTGTYQNSGFIITPPVVVQSFAATEETFSNYNRTNNTYDLTFDLTKKLSDGTSETTQISKPTVDASQDYVYIASSEDPFAYSQDFTFAPPVTVRDFTASEGTFTNYNASDNTYTLTFNLTKVLSKGDPETVQVTKTVDAASNYTYTASDDRAPGYTEDFSFTPPTVFRDFTFSTDAPVWTYNQANNTYSVSFVVNETWSNGDTATETITRDGLTPGTSIEENVMIYGVTHTKTLTVPAAPASVIPSSVTGTVDVSSIQSKWTGNGENVQETYSLNYTINGITYTATNLSNNFTKNGTGFTNRELTYKAIYNGQTVVVNYTLLYIAPSGNTNGK